VAGLTWQRRLLFVALAVLALLAGPALPASAASRPGTPAQAEDRFLQLLNQARQGQGLAPLILDAGLEADARAWSGEMAARGSMTHASSARLSADTARSVPGWSRGGENIGRGWDVDRLHHAFWGSTTHRANMLNDYNRVGIGVVYRPDATWVTVRFAKGPVIPAVGSTVPDSSLWLADGSGRVLANGGAHHHGDARGLRLNRPVVAMVSTATRGGYWLLGQDGGVFTYGDARFHGSMGGRPLNGPVIGLVPTPSGRGYWLVATDGGVFSFGDARFHGSTGGTTLNAPVASIAAGPGTGYWLVARDGGVFAFAVPFLGSVPGSGQPGTGLRIRASAGGRGYHVLTTDGRPRPFGLADPLGSAALAPGEHVVDLIVLP
jgi:hypothetical protein